MTDVLHKPADDFDPRGRLDPAGFEPSPRLEALIRTRRPQPDENIELINQIIVAIETDEGLATVAAVAQVFGRIERWLQ